MNKRTRLIVSLLFVVLIILAVAITKFYVNEPGDTAVNGGGDNIEKILVTNENGYSIFADENGSCGIAESGRVLAVPEWESLSFAGDNTCIASKKTGNDVKFGCIDYEGNITVPFIYSEIENKPVGGSNFYFAVSCEDGSYVIYDEDFSPCFGQAWSSCRISDNEFLLGDERGSYTYTISGNGLLFKSANLTGVIINRPYELNIYSRVLLSELTAGMIERMAEFTEAYVAYAFNGDDTALKEMGGDTRSFTGVFPDSDEITARRLIDVPEIHVYNVGSEDGTPLYEVSVSADAEILYTAENGETERMKNNLKASVRFRGNYETDLEAVSGSFEPQVPDYPQEETTAEEAVQTNQQIGE